MNALPPARLERLRQLSHDGQPDSPFSARLGIRLERVEPGTVWASLPTGGAALHNPLGILHGGVVASLSDHVMGLAMLSLLPDDEVFSTVELKVNYLRAVKSDCTLRAVGKVLKFGRSIAVVESDVFEGEALVARVSSTCLRMAMRPAP
ncbi:MAG: PaaI family thioesterase [Myxococcaceae bacterium]